MNTESSHRQLIRRGVAVVAVSCVAVGGVLYIEGEVAAALASVTFALINSVLAGLSFASRPRTHTLGHLLLANLTAFLTAMSLLFGHYEGLAPYALPALAALATFLVGRKGAIGWTLASVGLQTAILALPAPLRLNLHQGPIDALEHHTIVVATTVAVLAIAVLYDSTTKRRQVEAEAQRARAEEAQTQAEVAQRAAEQALARAEAANVAKSAFLAAMSHEIRTPLNALIGATELLEESDPYERERLEATIRDAGTTLLGQMGDVLDFSRIEAGALQLNPRPSSPAGVVREVCSVLNPRAVDKDLRLRVELPPSDPTLRLIDPDRLRQILLNLVGNALKFTQQGHVRVALRSEQDHLQITVEDTGPGIPAELKTQIFEPFRQAEEGLKRRHQGYGLGLAISKGIAEAMGGTLRLCPRGESGACFALELPAPIAQDQGTQAVGDLRDVEVLLVEDNPVNRMIARTMLERLGCEVREATNGQEAVDAVRERCPQVVLMDLQMPVMDGLEATRRINELNLERPPPILALTANAFAEDREAALALGMVDFLPKPVNQDALATALTAYATPQPERLGA